MQREHFYGIRFAVEGNTQFPADMLRYDRCCPLSESDAHTIEKYVSRDELSLDTRACDNVRINLIRFSHAGKSDPCTERWASFGWKVIESSIEYT